MLFLSTVNSFTLLCSSSSVDCFRVPGEEKWLKGRKEVHETMRLADSWDQLVLTLSCSLGKATQHVTLSAALSHSKCRTDHGRGAATHSAGQRRRWHSQEKCCLSHYRQLSLKQIRLIKVSRQFCWLTCTVIKQNIARGFKVGSIPFPSLFSIILKFKGQ